MIKTDVLIIIEHVSRELESACLLKMEFENRGYNVEIVGIYPNKEILPINYCADIIITPWIYTYTKYVYSFLRYSPDALLASLHQEQYGPNGDNTCIPLGQAQNVCHISWGEKYTRELIKAGCDSDTILTVGSVRLDFFKKPLSSLFDRKDDLGKEFGIDAQKKWVLVIGDSSHLVEDYLFKNIHEGDFDPRPIFKVGTECRTTMLEYIDNFLSENSDIVFIYRPHPGFANKDIEREDINYLCKKYPNNFYAIFKYALNTWIISSDICLAFISTSFVECYFARTPFFLFRSRDLNPNEDVEYFQDYKYKITNYTSFVDSIMESEFCFDFMAERLKDFYVMDNEFSYLRVVDGILSFDRNKCVVKLSYKMWLINWLRAKTKNIIIKLTRNKIANKLALRFCDNRIYRIINDRNDIVNQDVVNSLITEYKKCLEEKN